MSTIDEVLATAEVVDAVCVIDGETRIISVPTEYKELGVESDEKVTRVKFQCPKIVEDNIDLTEYNLYINYRNADNKLNSYLVEDATVTDDVINFSWLLSRHVTESPGTINYIVCAKKSDYTGVINEWNTKVATGTVGVGLEATEEIEEQNIDIIEQILRSIVELENKVDGGGSGGSGGSGEDGGYYTPAVTQTTEKTMQVSFTPSKTTMPAVSGTEITLPTGPKGVSGVYVGSGDMPDGYNVQIDPNGTPDGIPKTLPNPHAITFTGAVTGSYDGSTPMTVEIPSGGSGGSGEGAWTYEKITLEEAVNAWTIPIPSAKRLIIIPFLRANDTDNSSNTGSVSATFKVNNAHAGYPGVYLRNSAKFYSFYDIEKIKAHTKVLYAGPFDNGIAYSVSKGLVVNGWLQTAENDHTEKITSVQFSLSTGYLFPADCTVEVWYK